MIAGAARVRRTAQSLSVLASMESDRVGAPQCAAVLDSEATSAHSWYVAFGDFLADRRDVVPPPAAPDGNGRGHVFRCVYDAAAARGEAGAGHAAALLRAGQHLDDLRRLEARLALRAAEAFGSRRG